MRALAAGALGIWICTAAFGAVQGKEVDYSGGGVTMKGYIVHDDAFEGKRPGVLVVHEWWGLNDYARHRADMLAKLGYTAMAVDMYGDGKQASHPKDAGRFAAEVMSNMDTAKARFLAALKVLKADDTVDPARVAAIGYCFGGGVVLHMARLGVDDLKGVVSFHGSLATRTPAEPGKVKARILVCHGEDDPLTSAKQLADFKEEMDKAGADYEIILYPNAKHSFTNPNADHLSKEFGLNGIGYNAAADKKSWADMQAFLKETFAKKG